MVSKPLAESALAKITAWPVRQRYRLLFTFTACSTRAIAVCGGSGGGGSSGRTTIPSLRRRYSTQQRPHCTTPAAAAPFSTTSSVYQKKAGQQQQQPSPQSTNTAKTTASSSSSSSSSDPMDFTLLNTGIERVLQKLKDDLSKLRPGGRLDPQLLEALRVSLGKGGKETARLGDVAQVVPRGRTMVVMVGEKEHLKPIIRAIQSSPYSLTPQSPPQTTSSDHQQLEIHIPIPPPTLESRQATLRDIIRAGESAHTALRAARHAQQKHHKTSCKHARPDDLFKAAKHMDKIVEKATTDVKRCLEAAKRVVESGVGGAGTLAA